MNAPKFPHSRPRRRAFSLVELLVVIALVAILAAASGSALTGVGESGKAAQALLRISETLERARGYAVSHNTYVWVAFSNSDGASDDPLVMAVIASTDGSRGGVSLGGSGTSDVDASDGGLRVVDRLEKLENCVLAADIPSGNRLSGELSSGDTSFATASSFTYSARLDGKATNLTLDRAVMFTPTGEAKVSPALPEFIQIAVIPSKGEADERVLKNEAASVIRISGLTGRVKVHRP